ncbi:MAG: AMP-binding protein [Oscillospiraceae bacterium]|nr:AMP-binding protein [Oscillospiraceae bacterium]
MNLSFSTRGWPSLTWEEMLETAREMGFSGIEVYNLPKFPELTGKGGPFHSYQVAATVRDLRSKQLSIPCFDTSCDLSTDPNAVETLTNLIEIAGNAQVKNVVACALQDREETVYAALRQLVPLAEKAGVSLLLKTSGIYADTARLRNMLDQFASDNLGALWDVHHPYRDFGESGDATIKNLGAYVAHVHLRDSDDAGVYQLIGEGTMPIEDVMRALSSVNYDGFISLEWKPEWLEDLQDPEIIFPYFVNYMSRFHSTRGMKKKLYPNHDGTGQYIWKKDELINLTFPQVLDRVAEEFPDQYCFKYTTLDYTRTYAQFREDVDRFARALVSMGVKAGSKVAIWATNVPAWFITFWATTKIGAVLVTVNTAYKIHEAEYLLRQSDTHTLVMIESCLDYNYAGIIN